MVLPSLLLKLIEDGVWPSTRTEALLQNINPLVPSEIVRKIAPDEDVMFLKYPPFESIEAYNRGGWKFTDELFKESENKLMLILGFFDPGSDNILTLDYRYSNDTPSVNRLDLSTPSLKWKVISPTFDDFAHLIFGDIK